MALTRRWGLPWETPRAMVGSMVSVPLPPAKAILAKVGTTPIPQVESTTKAMPMACRHRRRPPPAFVSSAFAAVRVSWFVDMAQSPNADDTVASLTSYPAPRNAP